MEIEGPTARVREFLEFCKGEPDPQHGQRPFDFNKFIPYPERFAEPDREAAEWWKAKPWNERTQEERRNIPSDGFNHGGYEWCVQNWGTNWNATRTGAGDESEYDGELIVTLHFATAWSPPLPVILKASEMFPDLKFDLRYFECGVAFNGCYRCEGGEVTFDESGPYFGDRGG